MSLLWSRVWNKWQIPALIGPSGMHYGMMLVLSVLATICGADNRVAIEDLGQAHQDWLQTFLPLSNGVPSHDTVGRV